MTIQKQILEIPLGAAGLQQSVDPNVVEQPRLAAAENVSIDKLGRISKRFGYSYYRMWSNSFARTMLRAGNEVDVSEYGTQIKEGAVTVNTAQIVKTASNAVLDYGSVNLGFCDCLVVNGVIYIVARVLNATGILGSELRLFFLDETTLQSIHSPLTVYSGTNLDGLAKFALTDNGTKVVHVVYDAAGQVYAKHVNVDWTLSGETPICTCLAIGGCFDVCYYGAYYWVAAHHATSGFLRIKKVGYNDVETATVNILPTTGGALSGSTRAPIAIAHNQSATGVVCIAYGVYTNATNYWLGFVGYNDALTTKAWDTTYESTATEFIIWGLSLAYYSYVSGFVYAYARMDAGATYFSSVTRTGYCDVSTGYHAYGQNTFNMSPVTRLTDDCYLSWVSGDFYPTVYSGLMTVDYYYQPIARYNDQDFVGVYPVMPPYTFTSGVIPNIVSRVSLNSTTLARTWAYPVLLDTGHYGIAINRYYPSQRLSAINAVDHRGLLYFSGGYPLVFDGSDIFDYGLVSPYIVNTATSSGGSLGAGTYLYSAIFEIHLKNGVVLRSEPETSVSVTSGASGQVVVNIHTPRYRHIASSTLNGAYVKCVLYRTDVGGSVLYRLADRVVAPTGSYAVTTGAVIAFTDSGTVALSAEALYTTGGVLSNYPCPPCDWLAVWQNRIWAIHSESKDLYYSFEALPSEIPAFNPMLTVTNPHTSAPIALQALNDNVLVVFYSDAVYAVYGNGPNDLGQGGSYQMQLIEKGFGCVNVKSIINTPNGLFFLSANGMQLIPAGGTNPQLVGADVVDITTSVAATVVSAIHLPTKNEVRWTAPGSTGVTVLIYNYLFGFWYYTADAVATYTVPGVTPVIDSLVVGNEQALVYPSRLLKQSTTSFKDYITGSTETYTHSVTTPWIKFAGQQGVGRAWRAYLLLNAATTTTLSVAAAVYEDYNDTAIETITVGDVGSTTDYYPLSILLPIANQKCSAIKFKITITSTIDADIKFKNIRLEYGIYPGSHRYPGRTV